MGAMDLRGLCAPGPFERIMDALLDGMPGEEVRAILPHMPHPLLRVLDRDGYVYTTQMFDDGAVEIRIQIPA